MKQGLSPWGFRANYSGHVTQDQDETCWRITGNLGGGNSNICYFPSIYQGFRTIQTVVGNGISEASTVVVAVRSCLVVWLFGTLLGGGFKHFFFFTPIPGEDSHLD